MRRDLRYGILTLMGLFVVMALAFSFSGPLVYSLQTDVFPSVYHTNTNMLKEQEINSTTDVLPLMQDLIDYTGPIIVNIQSGNVEQARRDLEVLVKNRKSFSNLVVNLDMNESEIQEFSKSKENQEKILQELLNSSVELDQLTSLQIQYRDENNPTMQTSLKLKGDTLRKKIRNLSEQYNAESAKVQSVGNAVGVSTTSEKQGAQDLLQYATAIDTREQQQIDIPIRRSAQVSMMLYPDTGKYGDTIKCFGYYFSLYGYRVSSIPGRIVTVYLDNTPVDTVKTDDTGSYIIQVPLEKVTAGTHRIHAESGPARSDLRSVTVLPVDSATMVTASKSRKTGEVNVTGTVIANQPVRNAPVELILDGVNIRLTQTNSDGVFFSVYNLTAGKHTVQARFTGVGYPINPSESEIKTIVVSAPSLLFDLNMFMYAFVICVFVLFVGGALYYLWRGPGRSLFSREDNVPVDNPLTSDMELSDGFIPTPEPLLTKNGTVTDESLFKQYDGLLHSVGLGEASHAVYCNLSGRIAHDLNIARYRVLTPREMSRSCRNRPYCSVFSRLVSTYELIRYGGYSSELVREEFEATMQSTDTTIGGEDH